MSPHFLVEALLEVLCIGLVVVGGVVLRRLRSPPLSLEAQADALARRRRS